MDDKDFKKQVQHQLEELQFDPGEQVWPRVQSALQKDKRRRWFIWFWLLAAVVIGGGLVAYFTGKSTATIANERKNSNTVSSANAQQLNDGNKNTTVIDTLNNSVANNDVKNTDDKIKKETVNSNVSLALTGNITKSKEKESNKAINDKVQNVKNETYTARNDKRQIFAKSRNKTKIKKTVAGSNEDNSSGEFISAQSPDLVSDDGKVAMQIKKPGTVNEDVTVNEIAVTKDSALEKNKPLITTPTDSTIKPATSKSTKPLDKKWKLNITVAAGKSKLGNTTIFGDASKSLRATNDAISFGTGGPASALPNLPTSFSSGGAYNISLEAEKPLGKKVSFITGIGYQYLSVTQLTGNQLDSVSVQSYTLGFFNNRRSDFHFLSVPAMLQFNVLQKNQFGIRARIGVNIMQLLASNAIVYDSSRRLYQVNNNVFNKTQVGLQGSLLFSYQFKNNLQLLAGPSFYQSFTQAGKSANYAGNYFRVWTIQLSMPLKKIIK
jgi:hypothetical protein